MLLTETFSDIVTADAPLARMTSFGIGGVARQLIQPRSVEEMADVLAFLHGTGAPFRVLGGGTNLLVKSREITEAVVHLGRMRSMRIEGERVYVEAGMPLGRCVTACGEAGLAEEQQIEGTMSVRELVRKVGVVQEATAAEGLVEGDHVVVPNDFFNWLNAKLNLAGGNFC